MTVKDRQRQSKKERSEERRRVALRRVRTARARRAGIIATLLAIPALWA